MNRKVLFESVSLAFGLSLLMLTMFTPFVLSSSYPFEEVKTITLDFRVNCLAVNEEMNRLYVGTENGLQIFDSETDTIITAILPDINIIALVLNPQTNHLYVVEDFEKIFVIDCVTNQQVGEIAEDIFQQREIALNPVTNLVYIADWHTFKGDYCKVMVYNGDTLAFITEVRLCSCYHTYVERVGVTVIH